MQYHLFFRITIFITSHSFSTDCQVLWYFYIGMLCPSHSCMYVHWIDRHMCVHVHCVYKLDNQHLDKGNISWKHALTRYCNIYQLMIAIFSKVSSQAAAIYMYMPYFLHCEDIKLAYTVQNNHFSLVKLISSVMLW